MMRAAPPPDAPVKVATLSDVRLSHACHLLARVNGLMLEQPDPGPFGRALRESSEALAWALRSGDRDKIDQCAVELAALALSLALPEEGVADGRSR